MMMHMVAERTSCIQRGPCGGVNTDAVSMKPRSNKVSAEEMY
jgi:hypothetical protein